MADEGSLPVCVPGLQGFPVQITGWSGLVDEDVKKSLQVPNDIVFQLNPKSPFQFQPNDTLFVGGQQFFMSSLELVPAKQEGLLPISVQPFAELQLWAIPTAKELQGKQVAVLIVPLYETTEPNEHWKKLKEGSTIPGFYPSGPDVDVMKYTTCVETDKDTIQILVSYWMTGLGMNSTDRANIDVVRTPYGIPINAMNGERALTHFIFDNTNEKISAKRSRGYQWKDGKSIPYFSTSFLGVTTPEFQKSFRYIHGYTFTEPTLTSEGKIGFERAIDNYKCIPLNRQRDIRNGKLMVDPRTGERLDEEIKQADTEVKLQTTDQSIPTATIFKWVCIVIGIILGSIVVYFLVSYGLKIFGPIQETMTKAFQSITDRVKGIVSKPSAPAPAPAPAVAPAPTLVPTAQSGGYIPPP